MPLHGSAIPNILQGNETQGAVTEQKNPDQNPQQKKKSRWKLPIGLMATGVAGAAVFLFRGCWHSKMSWPIRVQQHSYQVCLNCGIKRLFDEQSFQAYGPYSYDLQRLVAWERKRRASESEAHAGKQPA